MKRTVTQTEFPSSTRTSWPALDIPAMQAFVQENTTLPTYSGYTLMDMPRPPGNYSGVDTSDFPEAAELFQNGTVPDDEAVHTDLCLFCIKNKLADALSYLYVKSRFEWLTIDPDKDGTGMVSFVCQWAANIDFEMKLDFTEIQHDRDAQNISRVLLSASPITCLCLKFKDCPFASEANLLSSLNSNTALRTLQVTKISDRGIETLCNVLKWNSTIANLAIYKNSLTDDTAIHLCHGIAENTNLTSLKIGVSDNESQLIPTLSKAIAQNTCLESLQLELSKWSLDSGRAFAAALGKNKHLTSFSIDSIDFGNDLHDCYGDSCFFDHDSAAILFKELESNTILKSLKFNYCEIGDQISEALKSFISTNKTLTKLKLYTCNLGSRSAKAIAEALPTNTSLRSLDIGGNCKFEVDDWSQIIKSCKTQCPLTTLKLCRVSRERGSFYWQHNFPVADLLEMIKSNTTLEVLDLSCYSSEWESFSIDQLRQISTALNSNHTLINFILHDEDQLISRKNEFESALNYPDRIVHFGPDAEKFLDSFQTESDFPSSTFNEMPFVRTRQSASTITRFQQYDIECKEITGKVAANAEAQRLRFAAMQGLATLFPFLPIEPKELIVDNLITLNHEAPEESGLKAMRSLVEIGEEN